MALSKDHKSHEPENPAAHALGAESHAAPPGRWRLLFGPIFGPVWSSGLLLAATMFLPLCLVPGCGSDMNPWYPHRLYVEHPDEFFEIQFYNWVYLFGLLAGFGALVVAWTRRPSHFRTLWAVYASSIVMLVLGMWSIQGEQWRERGPPGAFGEIVEAGLMLLPQIALLATLLLTYFNCRTWFSAALWVQFVLAALCTAWFCWIASEFPLLIGGQIGIGASFVLLIGTIVLRWRGLEALGILLRKRGTARPGLEICAVPAQPLSGHSSM